MRELTRPETEAVSYATVYATVMAVQTGAAPLGVVPIENSLEGSVAATLDTLAIDAREVRIAAELELPIRHCLIARSRVALAEVERVISHPQALAQCARYLRTALPQAELASSASTAEGVRQVAQSSGAVGGAGIDARR